MFGSTIGGLPERSNSIWIAGLTYSGMLAGTSITAVATETTLFGLAGSVCCAMPVPGG
jgi:hypothetical protein